MKGFVIDGAVLPHAPQYFLPAFAQTAQRAGMAMPLFAFGGIINPGPGTSSAAQVGPKVNRVAQEVVARPTNARFTKLSGLKAHRTGSRAATQALGVGKDLALAADFSQKTRGQLVFGTGQTAEDIMIGMMLKGSSDALSILIDLLLEALQHVNQTQGQQSLGVGHRRAGVQLLAFLPGFQSGRCRARSPQLLQVQEFFPAPPAGFTEGLRSGEASQESPGKGLGPISKLSSAMG